MAQKKVEQADAAGDEVKAGAIEVIGSAAQAAHVAGNHAQHAALDEIHQALYALKLKIDVAVSRVDDEAAELLGKLREIL